MDAFKNQDGKPILMKMVKGIQDNKAYLGEVDGLIGDGDHGMNMNKGFTVFETRFADKDFSFTEGLDELGMILLNEIGGSMGPIYGTILMDMAEAGEDLEEITVGDLAKMLEAGLEGLYGIVDARVGDKTLVDTLAPSVETLKAADEHHRVFKLQFAAGEFDMVIYDEQENCCEIFEIKHSGKQVPEQYRHLVDEEKCRQTERRFGPIRGRYVLYRGETAPLENGVQYRNVESYLKELPDLDMCQSNKNASQTIEPVL